MLTASDHIRFLETAELQFCLAQAVRTATTQGDQPLHVPRVWTHGKHTVTAEDLALSPDQSQLAAAGLFHIATFNLAVHICKAFKDLMRKPRDHTDSNVRGAFEISRLIRNAFTHNPSSPTWNIDPPCRDRVFAVHGIVTLNTKSLDGKPFDWRDYGGPLALYRLSGFVREEVFAEAD